tara:strand:+ start:208 stop:435 length:228 start_codon:yes stop_codon:yes gene_type:complete
LVHQAKLDTGAKFLIVTFAMGCASFAFCRALYAPTKITHFITGNMLSAARVDLRRPAEAISTELLTVAEFPIITL